MNIKEDAEFHRALLELGLYSVTDVIAWCDAVIIAHDAPDIAIIEASVSGSRGKHTVIEKLGAVAGEVENQILIKRVFGAMRESLRNDQSRAPLVAKSLSKIANDRYHLETHLEIDEPEMWEFAQELDLALAGIHGDAEQIIGDMIQFLEVQAAEYDEIR